MITPDPILIRRFEECPSWAVDDDAARKAGLVVVRDAARDCLRLSRFPSGIVPGMDSLDWRVLALRSAGDVFRVIGEKLGMSGASARKRDMRARRQLLDYLSHHGSWVSDCRRWTPTIVDDWPYPIHVYDEDLCHGRNWRAEE